MRKLEYIRDNVGQNYIGINIYHTEVYPFLEQMKSFVGKNECDEYIKYQQERDNKHYHLTVINAAELNNIFKDIKNVTIIDNILSSFDISDLLLLGVGTVEKNDNKTFFIVCKSFLLNEIRKILLLDEKDLHITIGFKYKDVHGVRKNEILRDADPFIDILKNKFIESNNTFEFIKTLNGLDYFNNYDKIVPIKITDTYFKFKLNKNYYILSLLGEENKLGISCKWKIDYTLPFLPQTTILKKLKINNNENNEMVKIY